MTSIDREERVQDDVSVAHARAVAAMLDLPPDAVQRDAPLPPLWHWFYFPAVARASELGEDGHPRRGSFLPPVPLPRRMWAGGRVRFAGDVLPGRPAERRSRVLAVEEKTGRSGRLVVVTIAHTIVQDGAVATSEEQDLIYRERAEATSSPPPGALESESAPAAEWEHAFTTDPVLLFRFSALTFNGHRIHYDLRYATEVEGYPGLVVHAPLTALALLDSACRRTGRAPASFDYRAVAPVFCGEEVLIGGRADGEDTEVWAARHDGRPIMRATVGWQSGQ